ncbi:MAG: sigma factor-like helix-turn-helix DNA-binding protein [Anaerolineae bacterium]
MTRLITPSPLQRIIERETFREIISLLEPMDLIVAAMRLEGLTDDEIARILGVSRSPVTSRMKRACQRIIHLRPDLAPVLEGRRLSKAHPDRSDRRPLEQGWLSEWGGED